MNWNELDLTSTPRRRPGLAERETGDELVVFDGATGRAHVLNGTAWTVWTVLDGAADLATLAQEISEIYGVDAETVGAQLVDLARHLGRASLLDGVVGMIEPDSDCP